MDLENVSRVFYNTPLVAGARVTGSVPIAGITIEDKTAGSLTILHTVNQGSEIRIDFTTVPSYKIDNLRSLFTEGSLHTYDNNTYIVTNYGETIDRQNLQQFSVITTYTVEVSLVVYSYLKANTGVKMQYPTNGTAFIGVQQIAAKTGVSYTGFDFSIPVTKDSADTTFNFTLGTEINNRAYEYQHIVDYGNNTVNTRKIGYTPMVVGQVSPIQISGSPPTQYKNATVTWTNNNLDPFRNDPQYMRPAPIIVVLAEGDIDLTQVPESITGFTDTSGTLISSVGLTDPSSPTSTSGTWFEATKALHMVFDNGGLTKQLRITRKVDGATETVQSWRYGFMFTAHALAQNGGSPSQYWRCIEYTKTTYFYEPVSTDFSQIQYKDRQGNWRVAVVDPKLKRLLATNRVSYLTRTETTGYKYLRFQNEQQGGWDIRKDQSIPGSIYWGRRLSSGISIDAGSTSDEANFVSRMLNLYLFRKVPIYGATQYHLVATDSLYNEQYGGVSKAIQASIEQVPWAELPDNIKNTTTPDSEGMVGIAKPDPDSYKEYLVLGEKTENISLAWQTHPLAIKYSDTQTLGVKEPTIPNGSLPKTYLPSMKPYVIGESVTSFVDRKIIPTKSTTTMASSTRLTAQQRFLLPPEATGLSDSSASVPSADPIEKYVEYSDNYTAEGVDFQQKAGLTTFAELEGRPPAASIKRTAALPKEVQKDPWFKTDTEYYYSALLNSDFPVEDGAGSFQLLEIKQGDLTGTQRAIDFKVRLENAMNTKELTVDLGFYRPEYKVGNISPVLHVAGQWFIKKIEHSFEFSGAFLVAKPTKITMGRWYDINSQITTSNFTKQNPTTVPYKADAYRVLGSSFSDSFTRPIGAPSVVGNRGSEQPQISFVGSF